MKISALKNIEPQYIFDEKGKKIAVVLSVRAYENLVEELEDLCLGKISEAILKKKEKRYSLKEIKKEIRKQK
ncbi:MAG: hypothetical protein WC436_01675 [Candidatus Babeliales bacterium]